MKHEIDTTYQMGQIIFDSYDEVMRLFDVALRLQETPLKKMETLVYDEGRIIGYKESFLS